MRVSTAPVILFVSLASALPQWSDHYKREAPTPSPELVQRQESFVPPPPPISPETPVAKAAVRRQDSILIPPKRDVPPTPVPRAAVKEQIVPRQHTSWYVLPPRGVSPETPVPYGAPPGAIVPRQKTEGNPPARRADDSAPEPTEPPNPNKPARALPVHKRTDEEPITEMRRDAYANPEPTDPPTPCDQAAPAKIKPRTEEEEPTQPPKARDINPILKALSGTYSLVNTSSSRNGEPIPDLPYGKAPVGLLIYTESGFMSATITATEPEFRPNLTFPYQPNDSDADWALVGKHSIGYAGPYSVNEELPATETEGQIFHGPLTVANVPTWEGQKGKRNYTIVEVEENGEEVKYLKIGSERGNGYRGILWWKKVD